MNREMESRTKSDFYDKPEWSFGSHAFLHCFEVDGNKKTGTEDADFFDEERCHAAIRHLGDPAHPESPCREERFAAALPGICDPKKYSEFMPPWAREQPLTNRGIEQTGHKGRLLARSGDWTETSEQFQVRQFGLMAVVGVGAAASALAALFGGAEEDLEAFNSVTEVARSIYDDLMHEGRCRYSISHITKERYIPKSVHHLESCDHFHDIEKWKRKPLFWADIVMNAREAGHPIVGHYAWEKQRYDEEGKAGKAKQ